ncbi:MAG: hypothetical protein QOG63_1149, partial [Thermoleophilaceae bacterium]|nr:hypothetical protein [Thermoleophilaceae bacterium]
GKRSRLVAKVGSRKVTLAVLSLRKQQVHKSGGKRTVSHIRVRLSKRAATLVGRKLGGRALSARRAFASLKVQLKAPAGSNGVPAGSNAKTGSAALRLAPAFSDALAVAGLDLSTLPGTDLAPDGSLNMSVLSSTIDPQTGQGTVALKGGFQLGSGANAVTITDPEIVIDAGGQDVYGQVNGVRTRIAGLDQTGLAEMLKGGATQLHNLLLTLSPEAAQALNQAGGATLFVPGTALGDISVSLPPGG